MKFVFAFVFLASCYLSGRIGLLGQGRSPPPSRAWMSATGPAAHAALMTTHNTGQLSAVAEDLQDLINRHQLHSAPGFDNERLPPVVAVSIQVSKGQIRTLERLLLALEHPRVAVIMHLDEKARHMEHENLGKLVRRFRKRPGSFFSLSLLTSTQQVTYRGIVMVDVTLRILETFVRHVKGWRFFINISAQDYLLCRADELVQLLSETPEDANFLSVQSGSQNGMIFDRVTHVILDESIYRSDPYWKANASSHFRRQYPSLFRPYHGEAWAILSRPFATYVTESTDGLPRRMFGFYANAVSSPEGYFQSLLCASDFADTLINDCFRYIDWSSPSQHPPDIALQHLPQLETNGAFFARKVKDLAVIDAIDSSIRLTSGAGQSNSSSLTFEHIRNRIRSWLPQEHRGCDKAVWVNETLDDYFREAPTLAGIDSRLPEL